MMQQKYQPGKKQAGTVQAAANRVGKNSEPVNDNRAVKPIQKKKNATGLPDNLKSGIENLSGISMDEVKVHYNSGKPAGLNAHAYAQGTDIHIAAGQEKHLPHEAWHVVQQAQGRVKPTRQLKGKVGINDDKHLEMEADIMGAKALHAAAYRSLEQDGTLHSASNTSIQRQAVIQCFGVRDVINYTYSIWRASSWTGVVDSIATMIKVINTLVKGNSAVKIAALCSTLAIESGAFHKSYKDYQAATDERAKNKAYYDLIKFGTKCLTTIASIVVEYYGGSTAASIAVLLIDKTASELKSILRVHQIGMMGLHQGRQVDHHVVHNL